MHGAGLADESGTELTEDGIEIGEDAPEPVCVFGIVGRVRGVLIEADGIGNFDGHGPEFDVDAKRDEGATELAVKIGNRTRLQSDLLRAIVGGVNP